MRFVGDGHRRSRISQSIDTDTHGALQRDDDETLHGHKDDDDGEKIELN